MRAGYQGVPTWKRPARRRLVRRALLAGALVGIAALAAPAVTRPLARAIGAVPLLRVHAIEITGLLYLSPEEVRSMLPVHDGDNLLLLQPAVVEEALQQNARIESVHVTRRLGGISVRVRERRPFAVLSAGSLVEVDERGVVLPPLERGLLADRPVITGLSVGPLKPGNQLTAPALADLLRLVALLEEPQVGLIADISEIAYESRSRSVLHTARDQIPIVVDPEETSLAAMRALAATLRDVRARGQSVDMVDVRYRGQVIVRCAPGSVTTAPAPGRDKV